MTAWENVCQMGNGFACLLWSRTQIPKKRMCSRTAWELRFSFCIPRPAIALICDYIYLFSYSKFFLKWLCSENWSQGFCCFFSHLQGSKPCFVALSLWHFYMKVLYEKVQRANKIWGGVYKRETEASKQPNILIVLSNSSLCFKASVTRDCLFQPAITCLYHSTPMVSAAVESPKCRPCICLHWTQSQQRTAKQVNSETLRENGVGWNNWYYQYSS